jgi:hypothetical protein
MSRQDLRHVRILVPCVAGYLTEAAETLSERALVKVLNQCLRVVTANKASAVARQHRLDFSNCFPGKLRTMASGAVKNFCHYQLSRDWPESGH